MNEIMDKEMTMWKEIIKPFLAEELAKQGDRAEQETYSVTVSKADMYRAIAAYKGPQEESPPEARSKATGGQG